MAGWLAGLAVLAGWLGWLCWLAGWWPVMPQEAATLLLVLEGLYRCRMTSQPVPLKGGARRLYNLLRITCNNAQKQE